MYTEKKRDEKKKGREKMMIPEILILIDQVTQFHPLNRSHGVDVHVRAQLLLIRTQQSKSETLVKEYEPDPILQRVEAIS